MVFLGASVGRPALNIGFPRAQEKFSKFFMIRALTGPKNIFKIFGKGFHALKKISQFFLWLDYSRGQREIFIFFMFRVLTGPKKNFQIFLSIYK